MSIFVFVDFRIVVFRICRCSYLSFFVLSMFVMSIFVLVDFRIYKRGISDSIFPPKMHYLYICSIHNKVILVYYNNITSTKDILKGNNISLLLLLQQQYEFE